MAAEPERVPPPADATLPEDPARLVQHAMRPAPLPGDVKTFFTRRRATPPGISWFGFRSLWGHLRHFLASAIATEGIDSRDWMRPDPPEVLAGRVARRLGADAAASITEALGRDLWIDYLADTGEHAGVTEAVAGLVARPAVVPDPDSGELVLTPRGDLLVFGGDTAYPVATTEEIRDRVVVPFNRALDELEDGRPRALLGIPGNHDWYDGLDGFSRLFRIKRFAEEADVEPVMEKGEEGPLATLSTAARFTRDFLAGERVERVDALVIRGYRPMQSASFWVLPLAPGLHLLGVDRQLKTVDAQQRAFFRRHRAAHPEAARWILLPDPVLHFGKPSPTGVASADALDLDPDAEEAFVLSGDIHHYRREELGESLHVTAGGGGAFLHGAPLQPEGRNAPAVQWPDAKQTDALLRAAPFWVAAGRAGLIPHIAMGLLFLPLLGIGGFWGHGGLTAAYLTAGAIAAVVYAFLGGIRSGPAIPIGLLAGLSGAATAFVPSVTLWLLSWVQEHLGFEPSALIGASVSLLVAVLFGGFTFGAYLSALTKLGLEETQAFTALAHPGFKHFVRFRVRADGSAVDGWVIGLRDPLAQNEEPVLVDRFTWRTRGAASPEPEPGADVAE